MLAEIVVKLLQTFTICITTRNLTAYEVDHD